MHLYILRHGIAAERDEWTGDDRKRPLTDAGRQEMREVAQGIRSLDLKLDTLITSPLIRAKETAEFVKKSVHPATYDSSELLAPGCDLQSLGNLLSEYPKAQELMIVGHEPDLGELIAELIGGSGQHPRIQMKKGACCCIKLASNTGRPAGSKLAGKGQLIWHLPPQVLARLR
jgi:phosphohistidine phosphatase